MKTTKEQLAIELAKIRDSHAGWVSADERRRKEFAKAFSWFVSYNYFANQNEIKNPTWEEIFVEIGRLLSIDRFVKTEAELAQAKEEIYRLHDIINKKQDNEKI